MKIKSWLFLFITTLLIGIVSAIAVGLILKFPENSTAFELLLYIFGLIGFGSLFSVFSQMGFFAYLTVHRFGLGIFKSHRLWNGVQLILIAVVLFDLFYLRYTSFYKEGDSITNYILIPLAILVYGLIIAYFKVKQTSNVAFIPTLFFITVVTILEWVPVLKENNSLSLWMGFVPLLLCNTYQILMLHRLLQKNNQKKPIAS
ncbi:KinB-signaling pathway activation protein [Fictibacillus phosphorivorans]|uniref:KinB-signaling pathway activation protein n=1 Tax=Fictibacillus phosphorivorans TaxID=1221500 RepID=UPI0020413D1C|nr:KinB-signaling pathway activation protein [Fictibacillus phosphorivorans]MCM3777410.1 KinB-signaling pathway activation protein [Fictibacillus phosphorivorans]